MRIISQDGKGDMPYKKFIFRVHVNMIVASEDISMVSNNIQRQIVAKYSSGEKAIKALEMLREKYSILKSMEMIGLEEIKRVFDDSEEVAELVKPYFKFPKDVEIGLGEEMP